MNKCVINTKDYSGLGLPFPQNGRRPMIKVFYDTKADFLGTRYEHHTKDFESLEDITEWIFGQMYQDYKKNMHFPDPDKTDSGDTELEHTVCFIGEPSGTEISIRKMEENGKILYSDGKMTSGLWHMSNAVKTWCRECIRQQESPDFNFAE